MTLAIVIVTHFLVVEIGHAAITGAKAGHAAGVRQDLESPNLNFSIWRSTNGEEKVQHSKYLRTE
jgi:hypothetical protein